MFEFMLCNKQRRVLSADTNRRTFEDCKCDANIIYKHVPNIYSFRKERWLHYMSKITEMNENLYNIYSFMFQMIHLDILNAYSVHHLTKIMHARTHTYTQAHSRTHFSLCCLIMLIQKTNLSAHLKKRTKVHCVGPTS